MRAHIIGSGFATGEHCLTNQQMQRVFDSDDAWIRERTGIEQRYFAAPGTTTSDLGTRAAEKALADAGLAKDEVDYVVFATMTPDYYFPGCASLLQRKLGLKNVPALDIRQQCAGFLYGMQVSDALIRSGAARNVLLVGAEVHSGFLPLKQWDYLLTGTGAPPAAEERAFLTQFRDRAVLFGDAGAAVVLKGTEEPQRGFVGFAIHAEGEGFQHLHVPSIGSAFRPYVREEDVREGRTVPAMNGKAVYRMAVTKLPEVVREICAAHQVGVGDIDLLIAHQANLRINEAVQKTLGLSDERVYNNIQRYGNTTAATIPIALDECRRAGRVKPGSLVCFVALGSGYHWGAALMRA